MHDIPAWRVPDVDLHNLPVFTPDPALWPRVLAAQQRRTRRRRWRDGALSVAAAATVCAAVLWLPHPQPAPQQELAATQGESRRLEREWQRMAGQAMPGAPVVARLRLLDEALQAAYDRGADARELAPLWQQRNEALRGLIERVRDTDGHAALLVTRI